MQPSLMLNSWTWLKCLLVTMNFVFTLCWTNGIEHTQVSILDNSVIEGLWSADQPEKARFGPITLKLISAENFEKNNELCTPVHL